jgi:DNA-directed RNA polymerase specialized sigma24 family protein
MLSLREIEAVYRAQSPRFRRVAFALLRDEEDAREAVQEAFARAIRARSSFGRRGDSEAWLWRTLVNTCHDVARRRRLLADPVPEPWAASSPNGAAGADLRAVVAQLPERQRLVLFLRHYADLSYAQIAETLGIERGTVSATLHAARASLRSLLEEVET